jgi:hypothetical protein
MDKINVINRNGKWSQIIVIWYITMQWGRCSPKIIFVNKKKTQSSKRSHKIYKNHSNGIIF